MPVDYRVGGGPELLATVRALGRRMLAATESATVEPVTTPGST